MEIEFRCSCGSVNQIESEDFERPFVCAGCGKEYTDPAFWTQESGLLYCVVCRCRDLYTQKDFNRKLGLGIAILGAVLAPFTKLISLFVCAFIDLILYRVLPMITVCYKCSTIFRGFPQSAAHEGFNLGINDRYRSAERS
jgi:hypothetical protein